MASETETARRVHANAGVEFDAETRKAYEHLDRLREKYEAARERFAESGSDEDKAAYRKAKYAFAGARTERKITEEQDPETRPDGMPGHPRGRSTADSVTPETVVAEASATDLGN
jgi:hypothetical protein